MMVSWWNDGSSISFWDVQEEVYVPLTDRERMPLQPLVSKTSHQVPFFSHLSLQLAIGAFSLQAKYPLFFKKIEK